MADARAPRDGKFIQKIGTYNPLTVPASINLDTQKALRWLQKGAQPTDTVRRILSFKGVLYLKHLLRGVKLGLFDEPTAYTKFEQWQADHEEKVSARRESQKRAIRAAQPVVRKVEEAPSAPAAEAEGGEEAPEA
ncbi:MAG: 30S ribosomal protein S16 [Chitinophaga sp.]